MMMGQIDEADCLQIKDRKARGLVKKCLQVDPRKRIGLLEAIRHPWLQEKGEGKKAKVVDFLDTNVCLQHAKKAMELEAREVLLMLVTSKLQGVHVARYQQAWEIIDVNSDGVISRAEFDRLYEELERLNTNDEMPGPDELFECIDLGGNGCIDFSEFVAFMFDPTRLSPAVQKMYFISAFATIRNSDGTVRFEDLMKLFDAKDAAPIRLLFDEMDANKDGSVSFDEFQEYVMSLCAP